jgi:molecular chaperone GrpE
MIKKNKQEQNETEEKQTIEVKTSPQEEDQAGGNSETPKQVDSADEAELASQIKSLKSELEAFEAKADEYLDGWQRARADFANYKKRINRERQRIRQDAIGEVTKRYLPVLDDLERALKNRPEQGEGAEWAEGIELVYRKMLSILESDGIVPMEAEGDTFNPNLHEAIDQAESEEHESDEIIEVIQKGYMIDDRVLRPAMVRVAK